MKNSRLFFPLFIFPFAVQAEVVGKNADEIRIAEVESKNFAQTLPTPKTESAQGAYQVLELSDEELVQQPELARQLLNQLIDAQQWQLLPKLLALYEKTPNPDRTLIEYAKAHILMLNQDYKAAIDTLRQIIAENDSFTPVRFLLAKALFEDYQDQAAQDQFERVRADNPPERVANTSAQYLNAINQRNSWDFGFHFSYLQEDNVNNASDSDTVRIGNALFQKSPDSLPQKAHGVQYGFDFSKKWNLMGGHYAILRNDFTAKQYWDNHRFDDLNNRSSLGWQYQNSQHRFALLPYYERRWIGGHRYSKGHGVRAEYESWLNPQWRLSLATEFGSTRQSDADSRNADNYSQLYSATLIHLLNAKTYFYAGADYSKENAKADVYTFDRVGGRLGWGQSWGWGISTRLNLYYAHKNYDAPHRILQKVRKDKEFGGTLTIWKGDWHLWGITPKLSFNYNRVSSNLPDLYSYDKKRVYLNFEKTF
ncbi:hypothetical protein A4G18_07200 [Pasteurellaceae bacterium Pebbles2]|nr:hypothetical protein [Pasteurellaceae bacterium Pebbles2]